MAYTLHYREPGKRAGGTRWAKRRVETIEEARLWLEANPAATSPAWVETNSWRHPETVAIFQITETTKAQ